MREREKTEGKRARESFCFEKGGWGQHEFFWWELLTVEKSCRKERRVKEQGPICPGCRIEWENQTRLSSRFERKNKHKTYSYACYSIEQHSSGDSSEPLCLFSGENWLFSLRHLCLPGACAFKATRHIYLVRVCVSLSTCHILIHFA